MMDSAIFKRISTRLDDLTGEMVNFQKSITAIKALSPKSGGEGEWDKAEFIRNYLKNMGIADIQQIDAPDKDAKNGKRPNLIARIPGKSHEKTVWIMAHMDVVPEGDSKLWENDPWTVVEKDGKIYGRGTEDNQQGLTSALFAMKAFVDEGIMPEYDLALLFAADEETGSEFGLEYILKHHQDLFRPQDIIIVPDAGEPDSTMIEVAEKSIVWFKFITKGKQCHGSLPEQGINAFKAASHLVVKLGKLYEIFDERDDVFVPAISTFEPTKKEANVPNVNTIPGEDIFYMDCRLLPNYSIESLFSEVRKICDEVEKEFRVKIEIDTAQQMESSPATDKNAEVVLKLKSAIKDVYDVEAEAKGIGGGTVAAIFRRYGLPAAVWSTLDDVCHQPNEYAVIRFMVNDAKVFCHVCLQK